MWLLWAGGAAYIVSMWVGALRAGVPATNLLVFSYLVILALVALLVRAVTLGRNWARIVYAVYAILAVVFMILTWIRAEQMLLSRQLFLVSIVTAYLVILALLFHPRSMPWFDKARHNAT